MVARAAPERPGPGYGKGLSARAVDLGTDMGPSLGDAHGAHMDASVARSGGNATVARRFAYPKAARTAIPDRPTAA